MRSLSVVVLFISGGLGYENASRLLTDTCATAHAHEVIATFEALLSQWIDSSPGPLQ